MCRDPKAGNRTTPASGATSAATGSERPAKTPTLALLGDIDRSLRLLDDNQLDHLVKAAIQEARRRGREVPMRSLEEGRQQEGLAPTKLARSKSEAPQRVAAVTPGQERLILAASGAGLKPAAIEREFRLSQATVQSVITGVQRDRRKTER